MPFGSRKLEHVNIITGQNVFQYGTLFDLYRRNRFKVEILVFPIFHTVQITPLLWQPKRKNLRLFLIQQV